MDGYIKNGYIKRKVMKLYISEPIQTHIMIIIRTDSLKYVKYMSIS
jgi:hypothetical protein